MPLTIDQQLELARQILPDLAPLIERHVVPHLAALQARPEAYTLGRVLCLLEEAKSHQAADTRRSRRNIFRALFTRVPELEEMPLLACTPEVLRQALDTTWPEAPTCWNTGKRHLSALFGYAIRRQWVRMVNPAASLDMRHVQEHEILPLAPSALRELLKACAVRPHYAPLCAYIAICAFAGVRPTECARLVWGDVDLNESFISVRAACSKTGGTRHIELHPTLRAWLSFCRPEGVSEDSPITPKRLLSTGITKMRRAAGFSRANNPWQEDCLRHSYATYYLKDGGRLSQLQLNMGHRGTQLLYSRYVNMRGITKKMARQWWSLTPDKI